MGGSGLASLLAGANVRRPGAPPIQTGGLGALLDMLALHEQARLRSLPWDELRLAILERDAHMCVYCGYRGDTLTLVMDHDWPSSRGGSDDPTNLVTACWTCNGEKGALSGLQYRLLRMSGLARGASTIS